jgi:hypothetical protein
MEEPAGRITEEYRVLHRVAQILQTHGDLIEMLQSAMKAIVEFEDLKVENKAGIFLADHENSALRLFPVLGTLARSLSTASKKFLLGNAFVGALPYPANC